MTVTNHDIPSLRTPLLEGLAQSQLRYLHCDACDTAQRLLRHACTACGSRQLSWRVASGHGTVHAVTEVARAPSEAYRTRVPYTLVLVDLAEGPRVMGHAWPGAAVGDAVRACLETFNGWRLLRFTPVES